MRVVCLLTLFFSLSGKTQTLFNLLPPEKTGISFQNTIRETSENNVLNYEYFYNGGGVAVGDLNNDNLPDIVFTANSDEPRIYFNKGNFNFEDVTKRSRIRADGWKTGVVMGDVNADGWLDIYICRSGNNDESLRRNLLFINQKNGTFRESAAQYHLDDKGNSTSAVFFDYDKDGDLDMFLLNHSIRRLSRFDVAYVKAARDSLAGDKLFRNDGKHFVDVSVEAGIIGNPIGFGLGVAIADFNSDGWPDIYATNDYDEDDYLYINQKNGTFKESVAGYLGHTSKFSMGVDAADVNNDEIYDLFTLDMLPEDNRRQKLLRGPDGYDHFQMLLRNGYYYQYMRNMLHIGCKLDKQVQFSEIGQLSGVSNTDWSWSALFADYDLDGWQDLFVTNGYMRDYTSMDFLKYVAPEAIRKAREAGLKPDVFQIVKKMPSSGVKNYLFHNKGQLEFDNIGRKWGMDTVSLSNGAAYADFDNDGDWDLVVNNINQPAFIWQNRAESTGNNFIKIKFNGNSHNPFGIGAKVFIKGDNGFRQLQELQLTHGYQSSVEPCLIFGIGARKTVDIKVVWPDDKMQELSGQQANKVVVLDHKNAGTPVIDERIVKFPFTAVKTDETFFRHQEDDYNDFKKEPLLPHQFSRNGPALAAGDVNGDGKTDYYIGGAKGQPGTIFLNQGEGKFKESPQRVFGNDSYYEDVEAVFGDFDNDKDLDLYVVSGGNESDFQDRIYWNEGKGKFMFLPDILPVIGSSGGAVVAFDYDKDGDLDIFRGGGVTTGAYPLAPRSYLLQNDHGNFTDVTPEFLKNIGMINTAVARDINKDGISDLIIAGEYMPVTILTGIPSTPWFSKDNIMTLQSSFGWWSSLKVEDMDNDGDLDIVAGNHGLNSQIKPDSGQPVTVDAADYDNNGSTDAIMSYYIQGKSYPLATRDELLDQIPSLKVKFPSYAAYAEATVKDIFSEEQLKNATHVKAEEFRSGIFINDGHSFQFKPFPNEAQIFPVRDMIIDDFNHDGLKDLLIAGNNYAVRAQSGRYDAGKGLLLYQQKEGNFSPASNTGFLANKDARKILRIDNYIIVANNNDQIQLFRIN